MILDEGAFKELGGTADKAIKYWNDAAPHLQARYCHASLGTKIKIDWFMNCPGFGDGEVLWWQGVNMAASKTWLDVLNKYGWTSLLLENCNNDADLVVYMANSINTADDADGYADLLSVCDKSTWGSGRRQSIVEWQSSPSRFGAVCSSTINLYLLRYSFFLSNRDIHKCSNDFFLSSRL